MTERLSVGDVFDGGEFARISHDGPQPMPGVRFIVVEAELGGEGYGHGPHDYYPAGWRVTAQRLHSGGYPDPLGKRVRFYHNSSSHVCIGGDVEVIDHYDQSITTPWIRANEGA